MVNRALASGGVPASLLKSELSWAPSFRPFAGCWPERCCKTYYLIWFPLFWLQCRCLMFPVNLFPAVGCLSCLLLFLVYFHWDYCQRSITASVRLLPAFDYYQR